MYALPIFSQIVEDYKQYLREDLKHHASFSQFSRSYPVRYDSLTQWMGRHGISVTQLQCDALLEKCGTRREEVIAMVAARMKPDTPSVVLKCPARLPEDKLLSKINISFPDGMQVKINTASPAALHDFINRYNHILDKQDVRIG